MHLGAPIEQQLAGVGQTLRSIYGEHVSPGQRWVFNNAGGVMTSISPLHVSPNEYLLFCGTPIGSEGHSGRHRADLYELVMAGELWTYEAGSLERRVHRAGDMAVLQRGSANGSKLRPGLWMLEYARGPIASLYPYALADTLFSTLDYTDLKNTLWDVDQADGQGAAAPARAPPRPPVRAQPGRPRHARAPAEAHQARQAARSRTEAPEARGGA